MKNFLTIFTFILLIVLTSSLTAQIDWTKYSGNPVLMPGPAGAWDEEFVGFPSVLFDGSTYHMWYGNYNAVNQQFERIGYATSNDGVNWIKYDDPTTTNPPYTESDPVLNPGPPGSYDDVGVSSLFVLSLDNTFHMWYSGSDSVVSGGSICHATSPDGITWTKDPDNPVLDVGPNGTWDDEWLWSPYVVFDGSMYHMWYDAWNGNYTLDEVRIGHATSPHPDSTWIKDPNNPVLKLGSSSSWDYDRVDAPSVIFYDSTFHMWYSGGPYTAWKIGYAWSKDGSNWNKYNNNPVLDWGFEGTFDDMAVGFCSVILNPDQDTLKMWYLGGDTLYGNHFSVQVGYATAPFDTLLGNINELNEKFPNNFVLHQNYPNPFNPSTTIEFTLPKTEFTTLKIFNILGKEVATLVSKKLNSGNHTYRFEGKNLASGVYYYQLVAGDYREVKKMILLR